MSQIDQLADDFVQGYADWAGLSFDEAYMLLEAEPLIDITDQVQTAAAWDESKHPRHPSGDERGGEFAPTGVVDASSLQPPTTWVPEVDRLHDEMAEWQEPDHLASTTKATVVADLNRRLSQDPAWNPEALDRAPIWDGYETRYRLSGQPDRSPEELFELEATDFLVQAWARSSSDSHLPSLLLQQAVADEFGLAFEADDLIHGSMMEGGSDVLPQFRQLRDDPEIYGSVRAFVRAQYAETQWYLESLGVENTLVYRGMRFAPGQNPFPHGESETDFDMNPASSWSTSLPIARQFASGRPGSSVSAVLSAEVPRDRVLSTFLTGQGAQHEYEVILVGAGHGQRDRAKVRAYGSNNPRGITP